MCLWFCIISVCLKVLVKQHLYTPNHVLNGPRKLTFKKISRVDCSYKIIELEAVVQLRLLQSQSSQMRKLMAKWSHHLPTSEDELVTEWMRAHVSCSVLLEGWMLRGLQRDGPKALAGVFGNGRGPQGCTGPQPVQRKPVIQPSSTCSALGAILGILGKSLPSWDSFRTHCMPSLWLTRLFSLHFQMSVLLNCSTLAGNAGCLNQSKPFNKIIIPQVQKPFLATTVNWKTFINW